MRYFIAFFLISFSLNGIAQAQKSSVKSIAGTTWFKDLEGVDDLEDQKITFLVDGRIYEELDPESPELDHHWSQDGNKITFSYNSDYAVYEGKMKGNVIKGKAKNVAGKKWTFTLTKIIPGEKST